MALVQDQQQGVVEVDADGMHAYLVPIGSTHGSTPTEEELRSMLAGAGVVFGIAEDEVRRIGSGGAVLGRVLLAEGTQPGRGKDGWVEFPTLTVETDHEPRNMRDRNFIKGVRTGTVVAVIHPPAAGEPGRTVRGQAVAGKPGVPAKCEAGPNVSPSPDDPHQLVSKVDGHLVVVGGGRVEVQTVVTIPGHLDLSIGNIDFCGSLLVRGGMHSDFTIKLGGTLEVQGNVEDSVIETGGNVTVHKGFYGHGKGSITSGGDIRVHHILNQIVDARKDVYIEKEAVNATVRSGGNILAPRAVIAGGTMDALHDIVAGTLGSKDGGYAKLRAGKRGRILERMGQIEKELKHADKQLTDVKAAVYKFVKLKVDGLTLTAEQEQALSKLQGVQKLLPGRLEALNAERDQLQVELQKKFDVRIEVHNVVNENVVIDINSVRKVVESAIEGVIFVERAGAIEVKSL